jgi:hypothetical protein
VALLHPKESRAAVFKGVHVFLTNPASDEQYHIILTSCGATVTTLFDIPTVTLNKDTTKQQLGNFSLFSLKLVFLRT